jgi:hypothetical protein
MIAFQVYIFSNYLIVLYNDEKSIKNFSLLIMKIIEKFLI